MGKYRVVNLHISPTYHYILSSISNSHGSPKIKFTALKEEAPKNIYSKFNLNQNILSWETEGQSTLVMTFDPTFMGYTW